jgi:anti-sigma factor RsiW
LKRRKNSLLGRRNILMQQGSEDHKLEACEEFEERRILFAAGDLDPEAAADLTEHLQTCEACTEALNEDVEMLRRMSEGHFEPDAALLASCRASLVDALDQQEERSWLKRALGWAVPSSMLSPRPAFSAALLLVIGFSVGLFGPKLLKSPSASPARNAVPSTPLTASSGTAPAAFDSNMPASDANAESDRTFSKLDIHNATAVGINVYPAGPSEPPQVEISTQQPVMIRGSVNDSDVKYALINALRDNRRFDPDIRLDAVDLLRARSDDPEVRAALCQAVHTDQNAAVRLQALQALSESAGGPDQVRQALLDALVNDQNPGVRVEAMNSLRELAEQGRIESDSKMLDVLRTRMQKDPNTYIRLQSAATLRDLAPSSKF